MFYETLFQKTAAKGEANYHSRYLSELERRKAFDVANKRRASRKTGQTSSQRNQTMGGAVLGGLAGLGLGAVGGGAKGAIAGGLGGGLAGAGLGYISGGMADRARDIRTREAQKILKMSPGERGALLEHKRARRLEMEDRMRRMEERAHRARMQSDINRIRRDVRFMR